jgi:hypothetical protein
MIRILLALLLLASRASAQPLPRAASARPLPRPDSVSPLSRAGAASARFAFLHPPASARPGVYWYFMDGNHTRESTRKDLEAMKAQGIGSVIFLEVNVGIPRGPVDLLSPAWLDMFGYAMREARRLGIDVILGIGPGWSGSGGPWVKPEESMQHLVGSISPDGVSSGRASSAGVQPLPVASPRTPFFGMGVFTPALQKEWMGFYKDVAVLAYPPPSTPLAAPPSFLDEKALYYRAPFSSAPGVKPFLPTQATYVDSGAVIPVDSIIDVSPYMSPDGTLHWTPPPGRAYTILRFVSRNNGAITRPAPVPGLGFEADKFDTAAIDHHLETYIGRLLRAAGPAAGPAAGGPARAAMDGATGPAATGGITRLHMDSWEMGAQNWSPHFRDEFRKRRGYDPQPYYPVYLGIIVGSRGISERFLWDVRQTAQELVLDNHAAQVKRYGRRHGLTLSIEPYDMNPTADLELGAVADVPMAEFWSKGYGFNTAFSVFEATSVAHVFGRPLVPSEACTADGENWRQFPGSMKNQGDWAFAAGINQFMFHTFQNQFLADSLKPGATMGPYGVHWDRSETWWPMAGAYHQYITRCSYLLQQGRTVSDILYLTPEGAPQVFQAPVSALECGAPQAGADVALPGPTDGDQALPDPADGDPLLPDKRGYSFDGCSPGALYTATVRDHKIVFPSGATYRVLVLPASPTMTPALLRKVRSLVDAGAVVIGNPPVHSPSLAGYPRCDSEVRQTSAALWATGKVIRPVDTGLYAGYEQTAALLKQRGVPEDFSTTLPLRFTHRTARGWDLYFVSNKTRGRVSGEATFRTALGAPELWDPVTGRTKRLSHYTQAHGVTTVGLALDAYQSFFVVFRGAARPPKVDDFPAAKTIATLTGPWEVFFDPHWGGPGAVVFDNLCDWTKRPEEGVRYYSGTAIYRKVFDAPAGGGAAPAGGRAAGPRAGAGGHLWLHLDSVGDMVRVRLNGKDLGVLWTAPWEVDLTPALQAKGNELTLEVVNRWPNRLIGDAQYPEGDRRRVTYTTYQPYHKEDALLPSGLRGDVTLITH